MYPLGDINRNDGLVKLNVLLLRWLLDTIYGMLKAARHVLISFNFKTNKLFHIYVFIKFSNEKSYPDIYLNNSKPKWVTITSRRQIEANILTGEEVS